MLSFSLFFFNDTATTEIYTLSLHDALPICGTFAPRAVRRIKSAAIPQRPAASERERASWLSPWRKTHVNYQTERSEEHTSELQSHVNLVCRLLLEKKKKKK